MPNGDFTDATNFRKIAEILRDHEIEEVPMGDKILEHLKERPRLRAWATRKMDEDWKGFHESLLIYTAADG